MLEQIFQRGLEALRKRNRDNLTVFMLAVHRQSMKSLNYLLELNINDVDLLVKFSFGSSIF